jgi:glutathione synthase/RimK-type ligase-like ATP-grasp enzyme
MSFSQVDFRNLKNFQNKIILYSSSEDYNLLYKNYIEDIVYGLELEKLKVVPSYKYLKSHHNKVFMEILRDIFSYNSIKNIESKHFGTYEEITETIKSLNYPLILKSSFGSTSKGVTLIKNKSDAINKIKKISSSFNFLNFFRDQIRFIKHKGYQRDSLNRNKFIVQNFIKGLDGDYKVLIFGDKYYVLKRGIKKNDYRASGSGIKSFSHSIPDGILDFSKSFFDILQSPFASLDICFDGNEFFLIEFQLLNFGTYTIEKSPFYFKKKSGKWKCFDKSSNLEEVFVESVNFYIKNIL